LEEINEALPKVQLRNKNKPKEEKPQEEKSTDESLNGAAQSALERAMGTLYEASPEMEDNNEGKIIIDL
jgi:hypothetical protein